MKSYWCFVLFLFMLSYRIQFVYNSIIPKIQKLQYFHKYDEVLINLLQHLNVQLRNIIVFDNSSSSSTAYTLSNLPISIGILLKSKSEWDEEYYTKKKDPIEIQGVILVMNDGREWPILHENLAVFWELNNKCVLIIMPKVHNACLGSTAVMQDMAKLHFAKSFFICMDPKFTEPVIYSHDLYGDTTPSSWLKVQQSPVMLYNWTMYARIFNKDDIHEGFDFNRTDVRENPRIMMYAFREMETKEVRRFIYEGDARKLNELQLIDEMVELERILNMKFIFLVHFFPVAYYSRQRPLEIFRETEVNVIINDLISSGKVRNRVLSYPTYYDHYIILSRDRGAATPLEKIANYYGIWTLVSLIIILILTSIVVWFKTNGRIASALFDSLRLLINSGIVTPINTLPLKIFFSMIFMYFIVIQSTFSGQLSKFLTIPAYLDNINSLDDLTQSRVKTVHGYFFILDDQLDNYKAIAKKYIFEEHPSVCFQAVMKNPNDVCIGIFWSFLRTIVYRNLTGYHISKDKLAGLQGHISFRPRFPFIEKFNWALMALSETRIYHRHAMEANEVTMQKIKRMDASNQYCFRPISFQDLKFAFILLIIGNSISFILFLLELSTSQYRQIIKKFGYFWRMIRRRKKIKHIRVQRIQVQPIE